MLCLAFRRRLFGRLLGSYFLGSRFRGGRFEGCFLFLLAVSRLRSYFSYGDSGCRLLPLGCHGRLGRGGFSLGCRRRLTLLAAEGSLPTTCISIVRTYSRNRHR